MVPQPAEPPGQDYILLKCQALNIYLFYIIYKIINYIKRDNHLIVSQPSEKRAVIFLVTQMKKLKLREVKQLAYSHTA